MKVKKKKVIMIKDPLPTKASNPFYIVLKRKQILLQINQLKMKFQ